MDLPLFQIMNSAIKEILQSKLPTEYHMLLQRARYLISINYGKALESLDETQNNAAFVLNSIFDNSSGGGDPSLFLDSPMT